METPFVLWKSLRDAVKSWGKVSHYYIKREAST
jgi:hypothetical protein